MAKREEGGIEDGGRGGSEAEVREGDESSKSDGEESFFREYELQRGRRRG